MQALPEEFKRRITSRLGEEAGSFFKVLDGPATTSIRLNPDKVKGFLSSEQVPWCRQAYHLERRPVFATDPLWHAGAYYVQDASSMILDHLVRNLDLPVHPLALDLCAAPGGKSTVLASALPSGFIVANEVIRNRVGMLQENLAKWGTVNTAVCNADPSQFKVLRETFDILVVDAPCSGEGLFRKDPAARGEWSEDLVSMCSARQRRILSDAIGVLKPGGFLVYSTCTFAEEENEANVGWLHSQGFELAMPAVPTGLNIEDSGSGWRFWPHRLSGEGFFVAVLRKTSGEENEGKGRDRREEKVKNKFLSEMKSWVSGDWSYDQDKNGVIRIVPEAFSEIIPRLEKEMRFRSCGISLAQQIRDELKPQPEAALAAGLNRGIFPEIQLDHAQALKYLSREEIPFVDFKGSWALIVFGGVPLGWVKNAGTRLNNYYPKEWRLITRFDPSQWFSLPVEN